MACHVFPDKSNARSKSDFVSMIPDCVEYNQDVPAAIFRAVHMHDPGRNNTTTCPVYTDG